MFLSVFVAGSALATIFPAGSVVNWQANRPGVLGGIPNVTNIWITLDTNASAAKIQAALLTCPSNSAVVLSPGTYDLTASLIIGKSSFSPLGQGNGMVLRGAGPGQTIIRFHNCAQPFGTISFLPANYSTGPNNSFVANWTGGYAQGSTSITLDNVPASLAVGTLLVLDQQDATSSSTFTFVDPVGVESTQVNFCRGGSDPVNHPELIRNQVQTVRVTAINGKTLTIDPPIYMTNWSASLAPQATWSPNPLQMCGLENMTIDNAAVGGTFPNTILFQNCLNCWLKNVETTHSQYAAVGTLVCSHLEIRDSYFHDVASGGGSVSYGVNIAYGTSDSLVENNIFNAITSPLLLDQGCSGNVFGYNYMTNMIYPGINLAEGCETTHGAHPTMNLFEGNYGTQIGHDYIHGSSSHNTHFRERMIGYEPGKQSYTYAVSVQGTNFYQNFVGCVFGTAGFHKNYEFNVQFVPNAYPPNAIYWMGVYTIGGSPAAGSMLGSQLQFRHGNYDVADNSIVWNPSVADHTIPPSMYLTSKPSWFGSLAWPPIDPFNPSAAVVTNLPAGYRFVFNSTPSGAVGSNPQPPSRPPAPTNLHLLN